MADDSRAKTRAASGPRAFAYAVGWTQHTVGVQYIRAAGIVQALLGNMGRPGGGILALRGHSTIQGSTDIATLYNLLPGYLTAPSAQLPEHDTLDGWIDHEMPMTGWWANGRKYMVSLLKAWYGDAATPDNEWGYQFLPKNVGDHSHIPMFIAMHQGVVKGFMAMGQNPAVGGQNATYQRAGLAKLEWMVVRDIFLTETAEFWKAPDVADPTAIRTEVFFLPSTDGRRERTARSPTPSGWCSGTRRGSSRRTTAAATSGSPITSAKRLKQLYAGSTNPNDAPFLALTWDFEEEGPQREPRRGEHPQGDQRLHRGGPGSGQDVHRPQGRRLDRRGSLDLHRRLPGGRSQQGRGTGIG